MSPGGTIPDIEKAVREICATPVEDDGLRFDPASVRGERIRDDEEYLGVRTRLVAHIGRAKIPVQVDVGIGNAVTPSPRMEVFPSALQQPQPRVLAYTREAVVAEKLEAMVALGARNSRMKDFYDLHFLAAKFEFSGRILARALAATFERRKSPIPEGIPFGLTEEFAAMPERAAQWRAFVRRGRLCRTTRLSGRSWRSLAISLSQSWRWSGSAESSAKVGGLADHGSESRPTSARRRGP